MSEAMHIVVWLQAHSVAAVTLVFALIWIAAYWPSRREAIERHGQIPFEES